MRKTLLVSLLFAGVVMASAQDAEAPKTFDPSEVESLRLQLAYKDMQIAQGALLGEAQTIKTAHNWPAEVRFDISQLKFFIPPAPPKVEDVPAKKDGKK